MKQGVKFLGGGLLAAFLLWVVLRDVEPRELVAALGRASIRGLLLAGLVNLSHNVFRAWRWGLLLNPVRARISFRSRFSAIIIGYLTTWTIPGRLGELVRPALLSAKEKVPLGPCIGSVVADRLLDGVAIVVLFALGVWIAPPTAAGSDYAVRIGDIAWALLVVLLVALALLIVAGSLRARIQAWVDRRTGVLRFAGRACMSLIAGTDALRRPSLLFPIIGQSLLAWLIIALATWIGVRSGGAQVPFGAILVLLPQLALGVALPTPGGAGGYHYFMKVGLQLYGVSEPVAVSAALLVHLTMTLPVIFAGMALLRVDGVSFGELRDIVRDAMRGSGGTESLAPVESPVKAAL